jgi:hypothetical protein
MGLVEDDRSGARSMPRTATHTTNTTAIPTLSERRSASRSPHPHFPTGYPDGASMESSKANPLYMTIPSPAGAAEIAIAALQYLPTPVLVLSSLKTVIMANESMGRLLGLTLDGENRSRTDPAFQNSSVTDVLRNQSLSQIGVDMLQDGQPIWVSWEIFLENLSEELDRKKAKICEERYSTPLDTIRSGETTPIATPPAMPCKDTVAVDGLHLPCRKRNMVHDAAVDVVLTSQYIEPPKSTILYLDIYQLTTFVIDTSVSSCISKF